MKLYAFLACGLCSCLLAPEVLPQTQAELTRQAITDFEKADAQLNRIYRKILTSLDAESQAKLRKSQRAWISYRDAQAAFEADHTARGGTLYSQVLNLTKGTLTQKRIAELGLILKAQ